MKSRNILLIILKMKVFLTICLLASVSARPGAGDREEKKEEMKAMMQLTGMCTFENWDETLTDEVNMQAVGECLQCFEGLDDPLTADNLPKTKDCLANRLPAMNQACSTEVSALQVGDEEAGEAVWDCLTDYTKAAAGQRCLDLSESTDSIEILTDSSMCIMETHKNITQLGMFMMSQGQKKGSDQRGPKRLRGKGRGKGMLRKYVEGKLLPAAYCSSANQGDDARESSCKECFSNIQKEDFIAGATQCSQDFLLPYYDTCHASLAGLTKENIEAEGKAVKDCYVRGIVKNIVSECNPTAPAEANLETLESTMKCGHQFVIDWVQENARPNIAKAIVKMISHDDDEDDDDE